LPKRMLWTERLFQLIPIGKEHGSFASFLAVRLIRSLIFTLIIFLISLPFIWISGIGATSFLRDPRSLTIIGYFFAVILLVFVVSGWFQNKWDWFFGWSSHILKLGETEFGKFRDRMEKFVTNFYVCLIITVILFVLGAIPSFSIILNMIGPMLRPAVLIGYLAATNFFMMLLMGTLLWIILSMWITFYVTLRQPLNLRLSPRTNEEFRPLAIWSLKALFVTLALITIMVVFVNLGVVVVPGGFAGAVGSLIFLVLMGVLAFLLPFYHIHRVLVKLKKQELDEIEDEHDRIIQGLTSTTSMQVPDTEAHMMYLKGIFRLEALHKRERRAKDADEWPIDITIISAMAGLVLIPILVNIITNFI
jgi:hypothetical protein